MAVKCEKDETNRELQLRWNDFELDIAKYLRENRTNSESFDVKIACLDEPIEKSELKIISINSLLLSACSPTLREILRTNSSKESTTIFLRNIFFQEMSQLLELMKTGQIKIKSTKLDAFMAAAGELKIEPVPIVQAWSTEASEDIFFNAMEMSDSFMKDGKSGGM